MEIEGTISAGAEPITTARWEVPRWLVLLGGWSWRILAVGTVSYFTLRLLVTLRLIVLPVLVALLAAALLEPVKARLVRRRLPNLAATWIVFLFGLALLAGVAAGVSVLVVNELADTTQWEETRSEVRTWLQDGPANLTADEVTDLEKRAERWVTSGVGSFSGDRARLVGEVVGAFFLTLVLIFFFVKDGPELWQWFVTRVRSQRREAVDEAGKEAFGSLRGYVRGVAITGVVDGVLIGVVLVLFGVPLALPLAALTFLGAFFPIVGATTVGALSSLVALVAVGPRTAVVVALATLVIQQVEGDVIMPLVMRRTVNLHPAVVLVALAVGGSAGGIAGAFIAVPVAAMVSAGMRRLSSPSSLIAT